MTKATSKEQNSGTEILFRWLFLYTLLGAEEVSIIPCKERRICKISMRHYRLITMEYFTTTAAARISLHDFFLFIVLELQSMIS